MNSSSHSAHAGTSNHEGRKLGPYVLTQKLGEGGMGEVWMGHRSAMGGLAKTVAIKTLLASKSHDQKSKQMFLDEARLSMLLSNSNIVQVFDADEAEDGTCYMAMEWVEGLTLNELVHKLAEHGGQLPVDIIAFVVGEVLKGLDYAHTLIVKGERKTIVHRDVSPHNVMISVVGEVKIMDFGIARVSSEETSGIHVKGKLRYMPPEQFQGKSREPTVDLFAVGAILQELLDGRRFRGGLDDGQLYGMILQGQVPALVNPAAIPGELKELRIRLLSANPRSRYQSAREAYGQLTRWSGYRDAKYDLRDIVLSVLEPAERDITATVLLPSDSTDPQPHDGVRTEILGPGPHFGTAVEDTQVETIGWTVGTSVRAGQEATGRRAKIFILVSSLLGVGFGIVGLGMALRWWPPPTVPEITEASPLDPADAKSPRQPPKPQVAESIPIAPPQPGEPAEPEPIPASELETGLPSITNAPTLSPDEEASKPKPQPERAKVKRIPVRLVLTGSQFMAQIKIGSGTPHTLEKLGQKSAMLKLKQASEYQVQYREDITGAWRSAGTIRIPADANSATIEVGARGTLTVK